MVKITWHGHACFQITTADNKIIVIDPHDGYSIGLKPPRVKGDIILVTHDHFDHNAVEVVRKPESIILKEHVGEKKINGFEVRGVRVYHDKSRGRLRGEITAYRIVVDNISIVHLGDLGHVLEEDQASMLKPVDVLLIPVGGTYTIEPHEAVEVIKQLEPKIAIPMHYWVPGITLPLKTIEDFLGYVKYRVERLDDNTFEVSRETLPDKTIIKVLKYK